MGISTWDMTAEPPMRADNSCEISALGLLVGPTAGPMLCGRKGAPSARVTTKSSSDKRLPTRRSSSARWIRYTLNSVTKVADRAMVRARPRFLGRQAPPASYSLS